MNVQVTQFTFKLSWCQVKLIELLYRGWIWKKPEWQENFDALKEDYCIGNSEINHLTSKFVMPVA
jgi:hypothetical protein